MACIRRNCCRHFPNVIPVSCRKRKLLTHCLNHRACFQQRRKQAKDRRPSCAPARAQFGAPPRVLTATPPHVIEALVAAARNVRCLLGWMRRRHSKYRRRNNSATSTLRNGNNLRQLRHYHLIDEHGRSPRPSTYFDQSHCELRRWCPGGTRSRITMAKGCWRL